jgi:hypothetical protein
MGLRVGGNARAAIQYLQGNAIGSGAKKSCGDIATPVPSGIFQQVTD